MANLDRTLDDMIKMNRSSRPGPRPSGSGSTRRRPNHSAAPYPYRTGRAIGGPQLDQGVFPGPGVGAAGIETGTKLLVSNLHYTVSDDDINELFSGVGELKRCSVHYNRSGRSEGTAEVVFCRRRDAETAIKRYNDVQLDGKALKIEIVGMAPPVLPPPSYGEYRNNAGGPIRNVRAQERDMRRSQSGGRGMRRGRGGSRGGRGEQISAEDLDADLDKYLAETKDTD